MYAYTHKKGLVRYNLIAQFFKNSNCNFFGKRQKNKNSQVLVCVDANVFLRINL